MCVRPSGEKGRRCPMASQYRKIADFTDTLWDAESPVVLEKMRLAYDRTYGTNVLQITFRNVSELNIYGLSVSITLKDESGKPIYQEVDYNYYGMEVPCGRTFGAGDDIIVEPEAVSFDVTVKRAELSDGKAFRGIARLKKIPPAQPLCVLGEWEQPFLERLEQTYPKSRALFAPERRENYWRCTCGRIYPHSLEKCTACRIRRDVLVNILPELKREKRKRDEEAARLERERLEEEARLREEEEQRRLEEEQRLREEQERLEQEKKQKRRKAAKYGTAAACCCLILAAAILLPGRILNKSEDAPIEEPPATSEEPQPTEQVPQPEPEPPKPAKKQWVTTSLIGEDIGGSNERTLWRLFGTTQSKLGSHDARQISSQDGARFFTALFGAEHVEQEALSSVLMVPGKEGSGLTLSLYNITYCTQEMYRAVLEELGFEDGTVIIAAPQNASGTTALAGLVSMTEQREALAGTGTGTAEALIRVNVRCGSGVEYGRYGSVAPGDQVEVLELLDNNWFRIVWPDSPYGYAYTCNGNGFYRYTEK